MIKKILLVLAAAVAGILIYASTKPDTFRVERSTLIQAPPQKIFPHINDLHQWGAWSPWEKMDPNMKRTFGGATSGKGAAYAWEGNKQVGSGSMEIVDSVPPSKIVLQLHFLKPFEGRDTTEFTLQPEGKATKVTWSMYGPTQFIGKVMCVFMSMDQMIGKQYETGLSNLKAIAEKR